MAQIGFKTVVENGVQCSVWNGKQVTYCFALSDDLQGLNQLSLHLEQRGYTVDVQPVKNRFGDFEGVYSLSAEKSVKRVGAWAAK